MKTDDARRQLRESVIVPMGDILYNEMYFYVWFICLYHVFLIIIILANLFLLLRMLSLSGTKIDLTWFADIGKQKIKIFSQYIKWLHPKVLTEKEDLI
jgi:hypothetical protein